MKLQNKLKESGFEVIVNSDKPRRGAFTVIIVKQGVRHNMIELLNMVRPFSLLKALDIEKVADDIIQSYVSL